MHVGEGGIQLERPPEQAQSRIQLPQLAEDHAQITERLQGIRIYRESRLVLLNRLAETPCAKMAVGHPDPRRKVTGFNFDRSLEVAERLLVASHII